MINIIKTEKGLLVGGMKWLPIDSIESPRSEINEIIKRHNADDANKDSLLGNKYAVCSTPQGACAAGIASVNKIIPPKAISLAARCSQFALEQKTPDAIFGWKISDNEFNLIGILNGLPIYDSVLSHSVFKTELPFLLSMFEMGCTTFGDKALFIPPVVQVSLSDLADEKNDQGKIKISGTALWVQIVVLISVISVIGGYFIWSSEEQARKKEAELAAQNQEQKLTPREEFIKLQSGGILSIQGCAETEIPTNKMFEMNHLIRGYQVSTVTANCNDGTISAKYLSGSPADLSVQQSDQRIKLTETLIDASISDSFQIQPPKLLSDKMVTWQKWLVNAGNYKQKISKVGVQMIFGAANPAFGLPPEDITNIPVIVKGNLTITGPAQFMKDAINLIDNVTWNTLSIDNKNGLLTFNATGDYYAIKD